MAAETAAFASVKLPTHLVDQARSAAAPMRRSVAGQIEYWATLGRIAEETGLTVHEAREAIAQYDAARQTLAPDPLDALEVAFVKADQQGTLAAAVRKTVQSNRKKALQAA
jgi:hypothetical protein